MPTSHMHSNTRSFATIIAPYQIAHTGTHDIVQKTTNKCMTNDQVQYYGNIELDNLSYIYLFFFWTMSWLPVCAIWYGAIIVANERVL